MTDVAVRPPLTPERPFPAGREADDVLHRRDDHQSSIMRVFPRWAEFLGLGDVVIQGMNFRWHDEPENYRRAVEPSSRTTRCRWGPWSPRTSSTCCRPAATSSTGSTNSPN